MGRFRLVSAIEAGRPPGTLSGVDGPRHAVSLRDVAVQVVGVCRAFHHLDGLCDLKAGQRAIRGSDVDRVGLTHP